MAEITPNDIINKEFRIAFRGYAPEPVDEYLQQISDRLFRVLEDNQRLKAQADDLRSRVQQYQQTEDLMKSALMLAERTAEETRQHARQEAELILREAEQRVATERAALDELRRERQRIMAELRAVLQRHLSLLDTDEER